jgi:hypothetical protein
MCDLFKDGYCGNTLTEKQLEELVLYTDGDGPQICVRNDEETNKELKRIHEESVKKYGTCIADHTSVEDVVIVEEDDGYCD